MSSVFFYSFSYNMLRNAIGLVIASIALLTVSCNKIDKRAKVVIAELNKETEVSLFEIGGQARIVPIISDRVIGNITWIKKYGDNIILYDDSQRQIWFVDKDGKAVLFDRLGRGPEEYIDISCFAYLEDSDELVIYNRHAKTIMFYSLTSYRLNRSLALDFYINDMEVLPGGGLIMAREGDRTTGTNAAIIVQKGINDNCEVLIPLKEIQGELFEGFSFVHGKNSTFFGVTGPTLDLYSYNTYLEDLQSIAFVPDVLGRRFWNQRNYNKQEEMLLETMTRQGGKMAVAPIFISKSDDAVCFWYITGSGISSHNLPDRNCCIVKNGTAQVYNAISCPELGIDRLQPIGSDGRSYISLITDGEVTPQAGTELGDAFLSLKEEGTDVALLVYNLL